MKLLFDENLSPRLIDLLSDIFPGANHVHHCGLGSANDSAVWEYAKEYGFTIVSKVSDLEGRSVYWGAPPKIIWSARVIHLAERSRVFLEPHSRLSGGSFKKIKKRASFQAASAIVRHSYRHGWLPSIVFK